MTFPSSKIREWINKGGKGHATALCPRCGIDSVLPGSLVKLSRPMLDAMSDYWFGVSIPAENVNKDVMERRAALNKLSKAEQRAIGLHDPDEWKEHRLRKGRRRLPYLVVGGRRPGETE
jgi:hypothetical protein